VMHGTMNVNASMLRYTLTYIASFVVKKHRETNNSRFVIGFVYGNITT
jgi:hypothetical protein